MRIINWLANVFAILMTVFSWVAFACAVLAAKWIYGVVA